MLEKHHQTPISLFGEDKESNILLLEHDMHVKLHQTLDIPGRIYGQATRKIKQYSNHKLVVTPEIIDMQLELQQLFFENLHKLPLYIQKRHLEKIQQQYKEKQEMYNKITGDSFDDFIYWKGNYQKSFDFALEKITECKKETSKAIIEVLKKKFIF